MLTHKQHEALEFICARVAAGGVAPTYQQIADAVHLKSKAGVHRLLLALEERGFIRRHPHRARAVEPLCWPDGRPFNTARSNYAALMEAVRDVLVDGMPIETLREPFVRCGGVPLR